MEKILKINDIEYIQRKAVKDIEKERDEALEKLKQISRILGADTVVEETIEETVKKTTTRKKPSYGKDNDLYQIPKSAQMLWQIRFMNEFGQFFNKDNRKLKIKMKHVLEMQKTLSKNTTNGDIKALGKRIGLDYQMIHRLAYNYKEGIFDKFIKEWNQRTQPTVARKNLPIQNNPEKRKESGMYGI